MLKRYDHAGLECYHISEQEKIINELNIKVSKIKTELEKTERSIALLQEYRTALISNAVTGKIDVRDTVVSV